MIKTIVMSLCAVILSTGAALAGVAPGCIGGCMGQAPDAGNITLPVGYQCVSGWPNWAPVSCIQEPILTGAGHLGTPGKHHHKG